MAIRSSSLELLANGQAAYNECDFWTAHDIFEDCWRGEEGDLRLMLQGLIQVATGFHTAVIGRRPSGAVKLLRGGVEKLQRIPDGLGGFAVERFRGSVAQTLGDIERWRDGELTDFDVARIPKLENA
jgi:predicted metal-dependent hydrolase